MKKVKFEKKLSLKKETVANLNNGQMNKIYGGIKIPPTAAETCPKTCNITHGGNCQQTVVCTYVCSNDCSDFCQTNYGC